MAAYESSDDELFASKKIHIFRKGEQYNPGLPKSTVTGQLKDRAPFNSLLMKQYQIEDDKADSKL